MKKKILIVGGTRPEIIKLASLHLQLKSEHSMTSKFCFTGQHEELALSSLSDFGLVPDYELALMAKVQSIVGLGSSLLQNITDVIKSWEPHLIIVQGDTTTAFFSALAAFYNNVPVAHVEAGLRSFSLKSPFPEEGNRRLISVLTSYHFCPTEKDRENLINEGIPPQSLWVTGNTGIDALLWAKNRIEDRNSFKSDQDKKFKILVTMHRRESISSGIAEVCKALIDFISINNNVIATVPVHPNPKVADVIKKELGSISGVVLVEPMGYLKFVEEMMTSNLILTDSGGIQEEAPYLGVPFIVARNETERFQGIEKGYGELVKPERKNIYEALGRWHANDMNRMKTNLSDLYGDGNASKQIISVLSGIEKWQTS